MAKLKTYYGLCPLIDQNSLLGISQDEEEGFVIVTLGKNMAIKYKFSDQKQIHSWSSKDHLTSCIVYDKNLNQYAAVFNNTFIRIFGNDCENLDRIKKYKFTLPIHTLISTDDKETYVIFKNGTVSSLQYALDNRKAVPSREAIIESNDTLSSCGSITYENHVIVHYLVKNANDDMKMIAVFLTTDRKTDDPRNVISITITRKAVSLTGYLVMIRDEVLELLTLWSDGKLYSMPFSSDVPAPGRLLSIIESLSCNEKVCMIALNDMYLALYGADKHQEGSCLVVYNIQFQVTQCFQSFKLYTIGSKMFRCENNLLLTVGNHLAVVPYLLDTEQLAALIGSRETSTNFEDPDITLVQEIEECDWNGESEAAHKQIPNELKKKIEAYTHEGVSESIICKKLIPELIEKDDLKTLQMALDYFMEIPESLIAELLIYASNKMFGNAKKDWISGEGSEKENFLNRILFLPHNEIILMPYLRQRLPFGYTLQLLSHLHVLLSDNSFDPTMIVDDQVLVHWVSLLLDIHYQNFILSKSEMIMNLLKCYQNVVAEHTEAVNAHRVILPVLELLKSGKMTNKKKQLVSKSYSVEHATLY